MSDFTLRVLASEVRVTINSELPAWKFYTTVKFLEVHVEVPVKEVKMNMNQSIVIRGIPFNIN